MKAAAARDHISQAPRARESDPDMSLHWIGDALGHIDVVGGSMFVLNFVNGSSETLSEDVNLHIGECMHLLHKIVANYVFLCQTQLRLACQTCHEDMG